MASDDRSDRSGWATPDPSHLPGPSFWPACLALGVIFFVISPAYEYVVSWLFVGAGLLLMGVALRGWIIDIRDDLRRRDE